MDPAILAHAPPAQVVTFPVGFGVISRRLGGSRDYSAPASPYFGRLRYPEGTTRRCDAVWRRDGT